MKEILNYCDDVLKGKRNAGNLEIKAAERFLNDCKNLKGYSLNEKAGLKACNFFNKFILHTKGNRFAGKPFILEDWEKFIIFNLFAWKDKNNNNRFNECYIEVAKKNGKSCLFAGLGLIKMVVEGEPRAEVYSAATTRDQAKIVWEEAKAMVQKSTFLNQNIQTSQQAIFHEKSGSLFKPVSSEANNFEGKNPNCVIIDEFHAHKTSLVYDNVKSAMANRTNPLLAIITTAGFDKESPCYRYRENAKKILDGSLVNDNLFVMIFAPNNENEWENPATWEMANPNMGVSVNLEFIESEYRAAKNNPDKLVPFLTKHLNVWTDVPDIWIEDKVWAENTIEEVDLLGQYCFGGLDLAAVSDANAFCLVFPQKDYNILRWWYWMPEKTMKKKTSINYDVWVRQGHIVIGPGNILDQNILINDIIELSKKYKIASIAFDPHKAYGGIVQGLIKAGIKMLEHGQSIRDIAFPTVEFQKQTLEGKIKHFGDPVTRWMLSNVVIYRDANDNIKIHKGNSANKVDGVVAGIMAVGNMLKPGSYTTYHDRGVLSL